MFALFLRLFVERGAVGLVACHGHLRCCCSTAKNVAVSTVQFLFAVVQKTLVAAFCSGMHLVANMLGF